MAVAGIPSRERSLFDGPQSLRVAGERRALWWCLLFAPATLALIGIFFPSVSLSEFVLLIVGGVVFVAISRGRLLGSSVRIHANQFAEIHALVDRLSAKLGIPPPLIFLRDDPFVAFAAVGISAPYALVISSQYLDHLDSDELAFGVGRELGHIAAGHTRLTSLLSVSGRENPVVALVFGMWLRKTELTADRAGWLCCSDPASATSAIAITSFHAVGHRVDMRLVADQRREIDAEPALRMGEWLAGMPYATRRLEALAALESDPLANELRVKNVVVKSEPLSGTARRDAQVRGRDTASRLRRFGAFFIDFAIIVAITQTPVIANIVESADFQSELPRAAHVIAKHLSAVQFGTTVAFLLAVWAAYSALLVAVCGQTLGMIILELHVVTTRRRRPSIVQSLWRYLVAFATLMIPVVIVAPFLRVQVHDRLSATRVVGERARV